MTGYHVHYLRDRRVWGISNSPVNHLHIKRFTFMLDTSSSILYIHCTSALSTTLFCPVEMSRSLLITLKQYN